MQPADLPGKAILGRVSAEASGVLTVQGDQWEFVGSAATSDIYNFEPGNRKGLAEASTWVGEAGGEVARWGTLGAIQPHDYDVIIDGEIPIRETGTFK